MVEIPKARAEVARICIEYRRRSDINRQASPTNRPIPDKISITRQPRGCALSSAEVNISTATSRQGKLTPRSQATFGWNSKTTPEMNRIRPKVNRRLCFNSLSPGPPELELHLTLAEILPPGAGRMQSDLVPSLFGFIRCRVLNLTSTGGLAWIQLTNLVRPNCSKPAYLTVRRKTQFHLTTQFTFYMMWSLFWSCRSV